ERLALAEHAGTTRGREAGTGRLGRGRRGHRAVPADDPVHHRAGHHLGRRGPGRGPPAAVRRARLVLPRHDHGRGGDDGGDLGHLPLRRLAGAADRADRDAHSLADGGVPVAVHRRADFDQGGRGRAGAVAGGAVRAVFHRTTPNRTTVLGGTRRELLHYH